MELSSLSTASRYLLSLQFLAGAQQRLLPQLTPSTSQIPYSHADSFRAALPFILSSTSTQHTRTIGWLLGASGILLLVPRHKTSDRHGALSVAARVGDALAVAIPAMFLWVHVRSGFDLLLPLSNCLLASVMWWGRGRVEYFSTGAAGEVE